MVRSDFSKASWMEERRSSVGMGGRFERRSDLVMDEKLGLRGVSRRVAEAQRDCGLG